MFESRASRESRVICGGAARCERSRKSPVLRGEVMGDFNLSC